MLGYWGGGTRASTTLEVVAGEEVKTCEDLWSLDVRYSRGMDDRSNSRASIAQTRYDRATRAEVSVQSKRRA